MQTLPIEFVELATAGHRLRLALRRDHHDRFVDRLRGGKGPERIVKLLLSLTGDEDKVIDAGANVGTVAAPLAACGRRVLAIEAMAENYVLLLATAIENGLSALVPVHAAVTSQAALLDITGTSAYARVVLGDKPGSTPGVTLDALAEAHGFGDATVMKLDVEGSEIDALAGGGRLLSTPTLRHVVYEANGAHCERVGYRPTDIAERFTEHGFEVFTLYGKTMVPMAATGFQSLGNTDCIASRPDGKLPSGYAIGHVDHASHVGGIVKALGADNHGYRRFMLGELRHAGDDIVNDRQVQAALSRLRDDEEVADETRVAAGALVT